MTPRPSPSTIAQTVAFVVWEKVWAKTSSIARFENCIRHLTDQRLATSACPSPSKVHIDASNATPNAIVPFVETISSRPPRLLFSCLVVIPFTKNATINTSKRLHSQALVRYLTFLALIDVQPAPAPSLTWITISVCSIWKCADN